MGVIAIIAALLIEQWRPLGDRKSVNEALGAWAGWLEQSFNGGERRHGIVAWLVAVIPAAAAGAVLHALFYALHPLLALAFNIAALYATLGFRQFSHHFTAIQLAVKSGDIERARLLLDEWRGASGVVRTREEVIRLAIEEALLASHRHVFGMPAQEVDGMQPRPELGISEPADAPFLDSTVGLVWRALVVWVAVLIVISIARLL